MMIILRIVSTILLLTTFLLCASVPTYLPMNAREFAAAPVIVLDHLNWEMPLRFYSSTGLVDVPLLSQTQPSTDLAKTCNTHFKFIVALLGAVSQNRHPFVILSQTAELPDLNDVAMLVEELPAQIEAVVWGTSPHQWVQKRGRHFQYGFPEDVVAVHALGDTMQGICIRASVLRKKLFRLLPISSSFLDTFCTVFRTAATTREIACVPASALSVPLGRVSLRAYPTGKGPSVPSLPLHRPFFGVPGMRHKEKIEYLNQVVLMVQKHHDSEFMCLYDHFFHLQTRQIQQLAELVGMLPDYVDALVLVPGSSAHHTVHPVTECTTHPTHPLQLRRLEYMSSLPAVIVYRTQSIRDKLVRLLPILQPFGAALCSHWNVYEIASR